jgi:hypothetical protein
VRGTTLWARGVTMATVAHPNSTGTGAPKRILALDGGGLWAS